MPNLKKCEFVEYRDYVVIAFSISTGIWITSHISIKIRYVSLPDGIVNKWHTKNRKTLTIPLNNQIIKILKEYLPYRQYKNNDDYLFCTIYGKQMSRKTLSASISFLFLDTYFQDNIYLTKVINNIQ